MGGNIYSVITGTGSYIPTRCIKNEDFLNNEFYETNGKKVDKDNQEIIEKFLEITTIAERRYVTDELNTSDIAYFAALEAIKSSNIDKEDLDYIIVAHNFGELKSDNKEVDIVPSLAARVKHKLEINNPETIAYDLPFGCPGWLQGLIQADNFIQAGMAKKCLVIGAETLSRVVDPHDRDSMIYSDGAGACIIEKGTDPSKGILSHASQSFTYDEANYLFFGESNKIIPNISTRYIKMYGRKI